MDKAVDIAHCGVRDKWNLFTQIHFSQRGHLVAMSRPCTTVSEIVCVAYDYVVCDSWEGILR